MMITSSVATAPTPIKEQKRVAMMRDVTRAKRFGTPAHL
jgi:hypothetical protein